MRGRMREKGINEKKMAQYCNVDALCEAAVVVRAVGSLLGVGLGVRDKHSHLWVLF